MARFIALSIAYFAVEADITPSSTVLSCATDGHAVEAPASMKTKYLVYYKEPGRSKGLGT